ncbi:MAG: RsmE family RNA methyltransferase [candidate division WOR-3 bacterium]|nr:RsmE family RNA methyltransferase [candidate division WOR-3 bacterium]
MSHRNVFYARKECDKFQLSDDELHHAVNVIRINPPSRINFTDGSGVLYEGMLMPDGTLTDVIEVESDESELINILFGICEKSRMRIILEKCTEIGVHEFIPLITRKSSKYPLNAGRADSILKSAIKQSGRFIKPHYREPVKLEDLYSSYFVNAYFGSIEGENAGIEPDFSKHINIFIGPPSGFTGEEEGFLVQKGIKPFHIDTAVLRTETFAVSSIAVIKYLQGVKNE